MFVRPAMIALAISITSIPAGAQDAEAPAVEQLAVEYYVDKYRVGIDEAQRRLQLQDTASGIDDRIAELLGPQFAGMWYDHEDGGRLKIGMTRAAGRLAKDVLAIVNEYRLGSDVQLVDVTYTLAELELRRDALRETLADMQRAGHARTGVNPRLNSIVITALAKLSADEEARIREIASMEGVVVRRWDVPSLLLKPLTCSTTSCDRPLRGGRQVYAQWQNFYAFTRCTGGFIARHRVNTGDLLMLTAGHCITDANSHGATSWSARDESFASLWLGPYYGWVLGGGPGIDAGAIYLNPGSWFWSIPPVPEVVIMGTSQTTYDPHYKIKADSTSTLGQVLCFTGAATGTHCAQVSDLGDDLTSTAGWTLKNAGELDFCATLEGDSGGPVIKKNKAFGMISLVNDSIGHCYTGYQGIRAAENILNVNVQFSP